MLFPQDKLGMVYKKIACTLPSKHDLLIHGNEFNLISSGNDLLAHGNNLLSCGKSLLSCGNYLLSCGIKKKNDKI